MYRWQTKMQHALSKNEIRNCHDTTKTSIQADEMYFAFVVFLSKRLRQSLPKPKEIIQRYCGLSPAGCCPNFDRKNWLLNPAKVLQNGIVV